MNFLFLLFVTFAFAQEAKISQLRCEQYNNLFQSHNICNQHERLSTVQQKDYPFLAAIGLENQNKKVQWVCSGILLSEHFVITTGNCVSNKNKPISGVHVRFNTLNIGLPDLQTENTLPIAEIFFHPGFAEYRIINDIALLRLAEPVLFNEYIQPACLHYGEELSNYTVVGYNARSTDIPRGLIGSENNEIVGNEDCNQEWGTDFDHNIQFCNKEGNISCGFVTGSPFVYSNKQYPCVQYVAGITDWRRPNCGGNLALNVRISGFVKWIENIVWQQNA